MNINSVYAGSFAATVIFIALGLAIIFIAICWFIDFYYDRRKNKDKKHNSLNVEDSTWYKVFTLGHRLSEVKTKIPMPESKKENTIAYYANIQLDFYDNGKPAYAVNFPDLEGCAAFGDTPREAIENAKDVLKQYLIHSEPQFIKPPSESYELIKNGITGWLKRIEVEI